MLEIALVSRIRETLDAVHPAAFNVLLAVAVGLIVYLWRKVSPSTFEKLPPSVQSYPALVWGAMLSALTARTTELGGLLSDVLVGGTVSGLIGIGGHHAMKASQLPLLKHYQGAPRKRDLPVANAIVFATVLTFVVGIPLLFILGCASPSKRPACAPEELAKIEAAFIAEGAVVCRGQKYETCPELPALREKYDALRAEWERCE